MLNIYEKTNGMDNSIGEMDHAQTNRLLSGGNGHHCRAGFCAAAVADFQEGRLLLGRG